MSKKGSGLDREREAKKELERRGHTVIPAKGSLL